MINILHGNLPLILSIAKFEYTIFRCLQKIWSRISKDTAGHGTENDLGDSFFEGHLFYNQTIYILAKFIICSINAGIKSYGHKVLYKKHTGLYNYKVNGM